MSPWCHWLDRRPRIPSPGWVTAAVLVLTASLLTWVSAGSSEDHQAEGGAELAHPPLEIPGHGTFAIYFQGGVQHGLWQR